MDGLTPKQARFVEEYLIDLNATQAAIRAGYSAKTAEVQGPRLLGNVRVAAAIKEAQGKRSERTEITQDMVLRELALIGFADMGSYMALRPDGSAVFDWSALPEGATKVVQEVTQEIVQSREGTNEDGEPTTLNVVKTKFKLYDKRAALVDIGKHLGMFVEKREDVTPPQNRAEAIARAAELIDRLGIGGARLGVGNGLDGTGEEKPGTLRKVH